MSETRGRHSADPVIAAPVRRTRRRKSRANGGLVVVALTLSVGLGLTLFATGPHIDVLALLSTPQESAGHGPSAPPAQSGTSSRPTPHAVPTPATAVPQDPAVVAPPAAAVTPSPVAPPPAAVVQAPAPAPAPAPAAPAAGKSGSAPGHTKSPHP
ncbi:hypothetical protein ABCS02_18760 [Microbacterium sp. X-17]|uniref:hypothetical protein n=1 Tax=Microbacterium sp. X-17 TaxID=3144404 RepID=UPI0031F4C102